MPIIRAQVSLDSETNRPEDVATNTYHFDANSTASEVLQNILDLLDDLYVGGGAEPDLLTLMASDLAAGTGTIKLYNIEDPLPRTVLAQRAIFRNPGGSNGLPAEVALVASFQGFPISGENQARRRGRVFIPWLREEHNTEGRPTQTVIDNIGFKFNQLAEAAGSSLSVQWVIWSVADQAAVEVANGWIDNAWDTQRRRGYAATVRTIFPPL